MKPPLNDLSPAEQKELLDDLNYLNMAEIRSFCRRHSIPFGIHVEGAPRSKTHELDRKGVILNRIRHFLMTARSCRQRGFPRRSCGLFLCRKTFPTTGCTTGKIGRTTAP